MAPSLGPPLVVDTVGLEIKWLDCSLPEPPWSVGSAGVYEPSLKCASRRPFTRHSSSGRVHFIPTCNLIVTLLVVHLVQIRRKYKSENTTNLPIMTIVTMGEASSTKLLARLSIYKSS
ncbi:hypothetical protein JMJ77_0013901 [Colletotrichum scovillei]|uniref:Uncharacterized protein n=1 Tax=Colletotrichum scovillei TaxID=1209932 RepID=A0A9P7R2B6_9PEZI|nr:hypothetical protein JMJ77_0013901 [Colletotrichum scovillei]KAG7065423.1 hypothetical protein JMJ78_0012177 [Colletotrichum scovillei]KAG7067992.1 hypothetical protein JMJ76_0007689 [Colletotrichum scovillei]